MIEKILWQLERHLTKPLSLRQLSDLCAVSPFHMARVFRQALGMPPMAYLRARRLSIAARDLALGDQDILTIALDAGYTSHEAFTRAFAGYFGMVPSTVRAARSLSALTLLEPCIMKQDLLVDVSPPDLRDRPAFRVSGLSGTFSFGKVEGIPPLWQAFGQQAEALPPSEAAPFRGPVFYGVCYDADETGTFRYLAGVEIPDTAPVPEGMTTVAIPARRYAVFTHRGHISDLPKTVYTIWNQALPGASLTPACAPEFELYDQRFDPQTGRGSVEIWIPLKSD